MPRSREHIDHSRFLDLDEAALGLGVSRKMVRSLIERGALRAIHVSGSWAVERESVARWRSASGLGGVHVWSRAVVWAAAALCDGVEPTWIHADRARWLRSELSTLGPEPAPWVLRSRRRAADSLRSWAAPAEIQTIEASGLVVSSRGYRPSDGSVAQYWVEDSRGLTKLTRHTSITTAPDIPNMIIRVADVRGMRLTAIYRLIDAIDMFTSPFEHDHEHGAALLEQTMSDRSWR